MDKCAALHMAKLVMKDNLLRLLTSNQEGTKLKMPTETRDLIDICVPTRL